MDTQQTQPSSAPVAAPRPPSPVAITAKALDMIKSTMEAESLDDTALRVSVVGGGCSGFQYSLDLDKEERLGDLSFDVDGLRVIVDPMSVQYLKGTTIDYVETAYQSGFSFANPNAKNTCGCGSSFSA